MELDRVTLFVPQEGAASRLVDVVVEPVAEADLERVVRGVYAHLAWPCAPSADVLLERARRGRTGPTDLQLLAAYAGDAREPVALLAVERLLWESPVDFGVRFMSVLAVEPTHVRAGLLPRLFKCAEDLSLGAGAIALLFFASARSTPAGLVDLAARRGFDEAGHIAHYFAPGEPARIFAKVNDRDD